MILEVIKEDCISIKIEPTNPKFNYEAESITINAKIKFIK